MPPFEKTWCCAFPSVEVDKGPDSGVSSGAWSLHHQLPGAPDYLRLQEPTLKVRASATPVRRSRRQTGSSSLDVAGHAAFDHESMISRAETAIPV